MVIGIQAKSINQPYTMDNQGVRSLLLDIDLGKDWVDEDEVIPVSE